MLRIFLLTLFSLLTALGHAQIDTVPQPLNQPAQDLNNDGDFFDEGEDGNLNKPQGLFAADLNNDSLPEVLAAGGDGQVVWFENQGQQQFGPMQVIDTNAPASYSVIAHDLTDDGLKDIAVASFETNKVAWYQNQGGGKFSEERILTTKAEGAVHVAAADMNADGRPDLLSASWADSKIAWFQNQGNGQFSDLKLISDAPNGSTSVFPVDLDGDGRPDVLTSSREDKTIGWYRNLGNGQFESERRIITEKADWAYTAFAKDLDQDGDADVLSASFEDNKVAWYQNQDGGNFGEQRLITDSAMGAFHVFAEDLNGDGYPDAITASDKDNKVAWYQNQNGNGFGPPRIISEKARGAFRVFAKDLDQDGDADILSASADDDKVAWYENRFDPGPLSLKDQKAKQHVRLYPNPSEGQFQLQLNNQWKGQLQIMMYNLQGQLLKTITSRKTQRRFEQSLHLPAQSGAYLVRIQHKSHSLQQKLLLQ